MDPDCTGIGVESIVELVDVEVQDADGAPVGWVLAVPIDRLLICFIGFAVIA